MSLEKLGPYRFRGVLGRGGMGTVYRGQHEETGEFHAVKVLAPTFSDDDHFRGRFESEIKALLKLNHVNVVQLLSYGQEDEMLFFAMELVEGNSLFQMQRQGHRFDWRQILAISQDVCQGLRHAHDRGIIHRDLKPGNLLMATSDQPADRVIPGIVKLTDFGIAKSYGSSQNTGTNVLGTMDFMSPEQAKGQPTTFRSDLYSLGTVMFTLLAGKPPFASKSVEESIRNLTSVQAPAVGTVVPDVPRELDLVIQQLMAKDPEDRIPTALALMHRLDGVETSLRSHSEAKTAERSEATLAENTFELADEVRGSNTTDVATGKHGQRRNKTARSAPVRTAEYSQHDLSQIKQDAKLASRQRGLNRPGDSRDNYFNTVTDHLRRQQTAQELPAQQNQHRGKLPLLVGLVAVVGLTAFGLYRAFAPVSADRLYEIILMEEETPYNVISEMDRFLRTYPDESRAVQVSQLRGIAKAMQFYNLLSTRARIRDKNLSSVEQQFLDIVKLAETNSTQANQKMSAFVTFHSSAGLSDSDKKVLEHAKSFQVKIRSDARSSVAREITQIRNAMETAAKSQSTQEAVAIYDSIVELYGNVMWGKEAEGDEGRRLVAKASRLLDKRLAELRADVEDLEKPAAP